MCLEVHTCFVTHNKRALVKLSVGIRGSGCLWGDMVDLVRSTSREATDVGVACGNVYITI